MAIPREHIRDLAGVTKTLTAKHLPMGADPDDPGAVTVVQAFKLDPHYLHVPRQFGLDYCARHHIEFEDHTSPGHPAVFPRIPTPRDYQAPVLDEIVDAFDSYYDFIFKAHTGWGKCSRKGTPVLMYDGSIKKVEDVIVGDLLMGPDSTPRRVLTLARGQEEMFDVIPNKGDTYGFNRSHILSLKATASAGGVRKGEIVDVSIDEYLTWPEYRKHLFKLWRTGVEFPAPRVLDYSPYFVGLYLGDGTKRGMIDLTIGDGRQEVREWLYRYGTRLGFRVTETTERGCTKIGYRDVTPAFRELIEDGLLRGGQRHIPSEYLTASRADRLQLLAGLIDSDGHLYGNCYDILCKDEAFAEQIKFLARSLGLAAYSAAKNVQLTNWEAARGCYRIKISGDTDMIPVLTPSRRAAPRRQKKDVLCTGFRLQSTGIGDYYGFTLDGDHRYMLGDFTVTHNTIGELIVAARLGRTTLVVVDQTNLMEQWLDALRIHFGMTVESGHVGIVQGKKYDYQGKSICIAMLQTLSQKVYPQAFYDYFGHVVFDEVHTIATPTFQVVMMDFPAMTRTGVSATPKDGTLAKLLWMSLGKVRVVADKEHDESAVYIADHGTVYSWYANISPKVGRITTEVSDDGARNLLLAEMALALYETGRDTLLLSDRIEQLTHMRSLLYYMGADLDEIGVYAGYHLRYAYAKNPKPSRNPDHLTKHADGNVYFTPVSLQLISKRVGPKRLKEIKESAGMLAATYGMCRKGFDEPRLRAGVDLTPRSKSEQIHGRILRDNSGKMAIWATIRDTNSYRLLHTFANRVSDYLKSNARLYHWTPEGKVVPCDPKQVIGEARQRSEKLSLARIETLPDGRNTLLTKADVNARRRQHVTDTVNRVRSRRPG